LIKFKFNYIVVGLIVLILGVAITVVVFSGKEIKNNHFQKDEISFDYPDTWLTVKQTRDSEVVAFTDPKADLNVSVNRQLLPARYNLSDNFTLKISEAEQSGFKFVSHKSLDFNGTAAQENVYQVTVNNKTVQRTEMWINKNDALYSIIFTTSNMKLNEKSPEIRVLTKNLTINNTTVANTAVWGEISIPTQGLNWKICDDSVNHFGSVYHNPSFYPGQNGTIGLLGHHTHYSAPFNNTNLLKTGDQVIITDYITQKKYVYEVASNGDIKSDYKTNPVKFPGGTFELTLITCYPPGFQEAAYMTHLKLASVEPI
jgi:Sortase (surface protein transpeptidase)